MATPSTINRACLSSIHRPLISTTTTPHSASLNPRRAYRIRSLFVAPKETRLINPRPPEHETRYHDTAQHFRPPAGRGRPFDAQKHRARDTRILPYDRAYLYSIISRVNEYEKWVPCCRQSDPYVGGGLGPRLGKGLPHRVAFMFTGYELAYGFQPSATYETDKKVDFFTSLVKRPVMRPLRQVGIREMPLQHLEATWLLQPATGLTDEELAESSVWTEVTFDMKALFWEKKDQKIWDSARVHVARLMVRSLHKRALIRKMENSTEEAEEDSLAKTDQDHQKRFGRRYGFLSR